jgi:hypothetical protein
VGEPKTHSESNVHFTVGSLRQTSRRAGGVDFKGELGLVKAALLYADGVELISVGASFAAGMDELARLTTPEKLVLLRRFLPDLDLEGSPQETEALLRDLGVLIEKLRRRRRLSKTDAIKLTYVKEKWSGIEQVVSGAMQRWGAEDFMVAMRSGRIELSPFSNMAPDDILKLGMGASASTQPLADQAWEEYRQTVLEAVSNKATDPLFDDLTGNIVRQAVRTDLIRPTAGSKRRGKHGGLSGDILQRLPMFEKAGVSEVLEIRDELSEYLGAFRDAVASAAATIESAPWSVDDFAEEADLVFRESVAPAVGRIEERVERDRDLRELSLRYGPPLLSGPASIGAFLGGQWALGALAVLAAELSTVAAARSAGTRVEQDRLYFYYRAGKQLRLRR